jgi:NADH:ubiquinone oxidoreductase subunit E
MAPNISVDDQIIGKATTEAVIKRIREVLGGVKTEAV